MKKDKIMLDKSVIVRDTTSMKLEKERKMFESKSSIDWNQVSLRQAGQIGTYRALVQGLIERLEDSDDVVDQATVAFALDRMAEMEEEKIYEN